jgi:transposase InsO family protein
VLNIDVVEPLPKSNGTRYILVAVDHYTKFGFATPVSRVNGYTVCVFLKTILQRYGTWKTIISDNAKVFTGRVFGQLLCQWKIQPRTITPRHPEANGAVERFV